MTVRGSFQLHSELWEIRLNNLCTLYYINNLCNCTDVRII